MINHPTHFYIYEVLRPLGDNPNRTKAYVAACDYRIFENKMMPPDYVPGTPPFFSGTENPDKVTCKNCLRSKKYKQAKI